MIGSMNAPVVSAAAAPGYVGRYLVTMTVSNGVPSGTALLQLSMPPLAKAEQKSLQRMENRLRIQAQGLGYTLSPGRLVGGRIGMALVETTGNVWMMSRSDTR